MMGCITTALNRYPELADRWDNWLETQMKKYGPDKDPVLGAIIRYAADGLWGESFTAPAINKEKREAVVKKLDSINKRMLI